MNKKHRATLARIFAVPTPQNVPWRDIEALLLALGAELDEGAGSRVRVWLGGRVAVFHRPHPSPTTKRGVVRAVRHFLTEAGVER